MLPTLGSRGYFFLMDTDGSRRSRVNIIDKKKNPLEPRVSVTGTSRERGPCEARGLSPFEHVYLSSVRAIASFITCMCTFFSHTIVIIERVYMFYGVFDKSLLLLLLPCNS